MARRPGSPVRVRMDMRERRDERGEKDGGSFVGGRDKGRKPLGRETVKGDSFANSLSSVGTVARIEKVGGAAWEPMVFFLFFTRQIPFFPKYRLAKTKNKFSSAGYVKEGRRERNRGESSGYMYRWPEPFRPTQKEGFRRPVLFRPLGCMKSLRFLRKCGG